MNLDQIGFLYVEDDLLSREIMQMMMQNLLGIQKLTVFSDSTDFIERVRALAAKPDVILLDIHVKPHNGFEMLDMLRADPTLRSTKVIALTASVMNEEVQRLRTSGFDGAIGKPLSIQTFPALVTRIVKGETVWHIA
jgi:CheY-like chemotaxis protein